MNGLYFPRRKPEKRHTWNREKGEPGPEFHSTSFRIRITRSSAAVSARGMRGEAILPIGRRKSPAHSGAEGMICTGSHNRCSQKGITMLQRLTVILCLACFWFSIAPAADPAATAPRYQLSTHILDVSRGRPASGVPSVWRKMKKAGTKSEKALQTTTAESAHFSLNPRKMPASTN